MKLIDYLTTQKQKEQFVSFEVIPPKRGGNLKELLKVVDELADYKPPFIDVTSHSAEVFYEETPNGVEKRILRKRPGTLGLCALILHKYNINAVPHVLCSGFTMQETEDFLIEAAYIGIENILAIRGDDTRYKKIIPPNKTANIFAVDLVRQIAAMNEGKYLTSLLDAVPTNFCIGVAGYPEKHFQSPNIETDIINLKKKIDAGGKYIVTQLFYDNKKYFSYVKQCRDAEIQVPIIPGIKILTLPEHLERIPEHFYVTIPIELSSEIKKHPEQCRQIGIEWAIEQAKELKKNNVPGIHFYIMQNAKAVKEVLSAIK